MTIIAIRKAQRRVNISEKKMEIALTTPLIVEVRKAELEKGAEEKAGRTRCFAWWGRSELSLWFCKWRLEEHNLPHQARMPITSTRQVQVSPLHTDGGREEKVLTNMIL